MPSRPLPVGMIPWGLILKPNPAHHHVLHLEAWEGRLALADSEPSMEGYRWFPITTRGTPRNASGLILAWNGQTVPASVDRVFRLGVGHLAYSYSMDLLMRHIPMMVGVGDVVPVDHDRWQLQWAA